MSNNEAIELAPATDKDKKAKEKDQKTEKVGFSDLFSFGYTLDKVLIVLGSILCSGAGRQSL